MDWLKYENITERQNVSADSLFVFLLKIQNMAGFLFDQIIFGPVRSRRFGNSLGVNLLPVDHKICTFDCIYCECGWTEEAMSKTLPSFEEISNHLEEQLIKMKSAGEAPDNITYAGNGEPTLHPDFSRIVDETIRLRDIYFPKAEITVLSNSSMLHRQEVLDALLRIDNNVMKLDAGSEEMFQMINQPKTKIDLATIVEKLKLFNGRLTIQTLFLRGAYKGKRIDNTSESEINLWMEHLRGIKPARLMIYPIARETPVENIEKISIEELKKIAQKTKNAGFRTEVYE